MNKLLHNKWALACSSGLLFWLAWPPFAFGTPFLFIVLVPLFILVQQLYTQQQGIKKSPLFRYTFTAFAIWNTLSTYWIWNASPVGAVIAVLLNSTLMSLPFIGYYKSLGWKKKWLSYTAFISYWLAYEYFHLNWDLSWPWLTLGNGLAEWPSFIQWYEYTGVFGGTVWLVVANILAYELWIAYQAKKRLVYPSVALLGCLILPITISQIRYHTYQEEENPTSVVVVQPNIDPYNEKFSGIPAIEQVGKMLRLSDSVAQPNTEFIIWPETALPDNIWEETLTTSLEIDTIKHFLKKFTHGNLLTGASTARLYTTEATATARHYKSGECCYDVYNTALQIENNGKIQVYHKSKLVPGVEQMPFPAVLKFLAPLTLQLGGASGSLGSQPERTVFYTQNGIGVAPVICYESIYGAFVTDYVKNGAQFIAIITNDGWWGNTSGYHQHAAYARLRAIETRRSIARAANTGISCFINQRGDMLQQTPWWQPTALSGTLNLNTAFTFYTHTGDYLAYIGCAFALLFLLFQLLGNRFLKS